MPPRVNILGQRFGRLTVIAPAQPAGGGRSRWVCRCDCGNQSVARAEHLRGGLTKSCGCGQIGALALGGQSSRKHGHATSLHGASPTYGSWRAMIKRCHDPLNCGFPAYGARGIVVCERWRASFAAFLADMGERPAGKTLDRLDNSRGYEPGNCRWATASEQQNNRRVNRFLSAFGATGTIAEWAACAGLSQSGLVQRIKRGWDVETALLAPAGWRAPRREVRNAAR